jgi:hypothetical protein
MSTMRERLPYPEKGGSISKASEFYAQAIAASMIIEERPSGVSVSC